MKIINTTVSARLRGGERASVFWITFFLLAYISAFYLSGTKAPSVNAGSALFDAHLGGPPLDVSWQIALEYAARLKFQFGKDIVFTFGPLGYLYTDISQGYLIGQRVVFALAWAGVVAWSATGLAQKLSGLPRFLFIAWFLIFYATNGHLEQHAFLVMAYGCALLTEDVQKRKAAAAIFILVFAAVALIKFTFFVAAVVSIAICAAVHVINRNITSAVTMTALFCMAFLVLWLAAGQEPTNLLPWLRGGLELAGGYTDAMPLDPKRWVLIASTTAGLLYFIALAMQVAGTRITVSRAGYLLLTAFYTFLSWKQGFVRADEEHVFAFILFLPFAFALLLTGPIKESISKKVQWAQTIQFILVVILCALAANIQKAGAVQEQFRIWPRHLYDNANLVVKLATGDARNCYAALQPGYQQSPLLDLPLARSLIGRSTVDVISYLQLAAVANDLNYQPRPVIQGYSAYTPYLQDLNLSFFQSMQRPDYLLFNMETIDNRFATLDDATVLPFILKNYVPIAHDGWFIILRQRGVTPSNIRLKLIHSRNITFGETLDLQGLTKKIVIMKVDVKPTVFGRLVKLVYHSPIISINIHSGGRIVSKRFVPAMATRGFLLNPLIMDNDDVINMYQGKGRSSEGISFAEPSEARGQLSDTITVKLYEIER